MAATAKRTDPEADRGAGVRTGPSLVRHQAIRPAANASGPTVARAVHQSIPGQQNQGRGVDVGFARAYPAHLVDEKVDHHARARRQVPSRGVNQVCRQRLRRMIGQHAPQLSGQDIVDDLVFGQQADPQAIDGRATNRLVVIGAQCAMHRDLNRPVRPDQSPERIARCDLVHDAGMIGQLRGMRGRPLPREVIRRGDRHAHHGTEATFDQRLVDDLTAAHGEVQTLLDHIAGIVFHHQLDRQSGIALGQPRQAVHDDQSQRHRRRHPNVPGGRGLLMAQSGLHAVHHADHVRGVFAQILPIVRQAEVPRRTVKQPHAKMLLELGDLPADGRLAGTHFARDRRQRAGLNHPHKRP